MENGIQNLRLVVIDDNPAYLETAASVYDNDPNITGVSYAVTLEQGLLAIQGQKELAEQDGSRVAVVSDLFFPSSERSAKGYLLDLIDDSRGQWADESAVAENVWRAKHKIFQRLYKYDRDENFAQRQLGASLQEFEGDTESFEDFMTSYGDTLEASVQEEVQKNLADGEKVYNQIQGLEEEPSGIFVANHCVANDLPFCMVSQGGRHGADLAVVLRSFPWHFVFGYVEISGIEKGFYDRNGAAEDLFVYDAEGDENEGTDKRNPETFKDAVYGNYGHTIIKQVLDE
tara:strand:- start:19 stop:879 length:861 start_codon:yes stop_codon:yes gene_type:complete